MKLLVLILNRLTETICADMMKDHCITAAASMEMDINNTTQSCNKYDKMLAVEIKQAHSAKQIRAFWQVNYLYHLLWIACSSYESAYPLARIKHEPNLRFLRGRKKYREALSLSAYQEALECYAFELPMTMNRRSLKLFWLCYATKRTKRPDTV